MKNLSVSPGGLRRFAALFGFLLTFAMQTAPLEAAPQGRKILKMEIAENRNSASLVVPPGFVSVTLQRFERGQGWKKVEVRKVQPGKVRIKLPNAPKSTRWRILGTYDSQVSRSKFPAAFYTGKNRFEPKPGGSSFLSMAGVAGFERNVAGEPAPDAPGEAPVEADIWRIKGNHVFFFNQLRGLQVLDISNPVDPRLLASLRLPAVGEDLYLLPDSGGGKNLLLLTRHEGDNGEVETRIRLVRYEGGKLTVTHRQNVKGSLTDSRMIGDRLILATSETDYGHFDEENWSYRSTTRVSEWVIRPGDAPKAAGYFEMDGSDPVIAAGSDWMAVAVTPAGSWDHSEVTVFHFGSDGLTRLNGQALRTAGVVADQFKMQWRDHTLTTISEANTERWGWSPRTVLETFRVWGPGVITPAVVTDPRMGRLELAEGESLFATRFAGDKAYVVTFLQTDPLWIVDLSNPSEPVVAGHLEVPGWSTHLEPLGDLLFSVGVESGTVAASLFDVADPSAPKLLQRLNLGGSQSDSEATWDEKALKLLPDEGLAMIPVTAYDEAGGEARRSVQLIDVNVKKGELRLRGSIEHDFDPRRAELVNNTVISVSQRELVTAYVADLDHPLLLSQVALAWPVDRVFESGQALIQIENGTSYGLGRATARVSLAGDTEAILSETDLGAGVVRDADLRDGKLFILRETGTPFGWAYKSMFTEDDGTRLHLDVYDASFLPLIRNLGSCKVPLKDGYQVGNAGLVWPQASRPAVLLTARSPFWYGWGRPIFRPQPVTDFDVLRPLPVMAANAVSSKRLSVIGGDGWFGAERKAPRLLTFDLTNPTAPVAEEPVTLGSSGTSASGVVAAADGRVVVGTTEWSADALPGWYSMGSSLDAMFVIEVPESGTPVVRPSIDLPGTLVAVADLDREGFLAYTRSWSYPDGGKLTVSACDGFDAFEVAVLDADSSTIAANGRSLFIAADSKVLRYRLADGGEWAAREALETGWTAYGLQVVEGTLVGHAWNRIFAAELNGDAVNDWRFPGWGLNADGIDVAADGDLLVPFGEYGVERLDR